MTLCLITGDTMLLIQRALARNIKINLAIVQLLAVTMEAMESMDFAQTVASNILTRLGYQTPVWATKRLKAARKSLSATSCTRPSLEHLKLFMELTFTLLQVGAKAERLPHILRITTHMIHSYSRLFRHRCFSL